MKRNAAPPPSAVARVDRAAVRAHDGPADREPEAGALGASGCPRHDRSARRSRSSVPAAMPWPLVQHLDGDSPPSTRAWISDGPLGRAVLDRVLHEVDEDLADQGRVDGYEESPSGKVEPDRRSPRRDSSCESAPATISSSGCHSLRHPRSPPASTRVRSSRSLMTRVSRATSSRIVSSSSRRPRRRAARRPAGAPRRRPRSSRAGCAGRGIPRSGACCACARFPRRSFAAPASSESRSRSTRLSDLRHERLEELAFRRRQGLARRPRAMPDDAEDPVDPTSGRKRTSDPGSVSVPCPAGFRAREPTARSPARARRPRWASLEAPSSAAHRPLPRGARRCPPRRIRGSGASRRPLRRAGSRRA